MEIGNPLALYLLWLGAVGALLFALEIMWARRALGRFVSTGILPKVVKGYSPRRKILKRALVVAALVMMILAWAMPRVGKGVRLVKREGADVVIALDLSSSMLTEDVKPSRIDLAKRAVETLSARLGGNRLALVGFADDAFIYCPLTLDEAALAMFLDYLGPDVVADQGTDLGTAIDRSLQALTVSSGKGKAIILITDGEDHGRRVQDAVKVAKSDGVRIYALGVGTPGGEPIPVFDGRGNVSGYKRDARDEVVISKLDPGLLGEIARATGGESYVLGPGDSEITKIARGIQGIEKGVLEQRSFEQYVDLFQIPLAVSLLLLLAESMIGERRRSGSAAIAVIALALLGAMAVTPGSALAITLSDKVHSAVEKGNKYYDKGEPDKALEAYRDAQRHDSLSVIPQFNAGDALYKLGKYQEGAKEFTKTASASADSVSAMSYYNLGNSAFKAGDLRAAAEAYKKSLLVGPDDADAKFNLEYAMRMLKRQQEQQNQNQQNQQGGQDQQQQQQEQTGQPAEQKQESPQNGQTQTAQGQMTPDELKRILAAIDASDRETQQELLKNAARTKHLSDKDW